MKEALDLASKSGIHRLITALEERGFLRRLPHRARALEVVKLPQQATAAAPPKGRGAVQAPVGRGRRRRAGRGQRQPRAADPRQDRRRHAHRGDPAGTRPHPGAGDASWARASTSSSRSPGDSMINAGILDGDFVVIRRTDSAVSGDIVVALVDGEEATLKRLRKKGAPSPWKPPTPPTRPASSAPTAWRCRASWSA